MVSNVLWTTLPRHVLGALVMKESDDFHSQGVHGCTNSKHVRQCFFLGRSTSLAKLVASRRLVMHICESHDPRLICFTMAFDPSCVCSPMSPTTVSRKNSNCRATSEVRICCCVFPLTMRSIMFRPCSRRKHLLPHLNSANTRTERTLNKDFTVTQLRGSSKATWSAACFNLASGH